MSDTLVYIVYKQYLKVIIFFITKFILYFTEEKVLVVIILSIYFSTSHRD